LGAIPDSESIKEKKYERAQIGGHTAPVTTKSVYEARLSVSKSKIQ